ncbi:unnamed protein product [Arabidopsis halleri]
MYLYISRIRTFSFLFCQRREYVGFHQRQTVIDKVQLYIPKDFILCYILTTISRE